MSTETSPRPWFPLLLVGALGALDLLTGLGMLTAPEAFATRSGLPLGIPGITQGYGQRIALFGLVYLFITWKLYRGDSAAKRWLILPLLDESWNTLLDVQLYLNGGLPAAALTPMIGFHACFAAALLAASLHLNRKAPQASAATAAQATK